MAGVWGDSNLEIGKVVEWYNAIMSEDQFTKLFKYIEEFRVDINRQFDDIRKDQIDIKGALGGA